MNNSTMYLSRSEVINYLDISEWKMKKLIEEEVLTPDKYIKSHFGRNAYLFNIFKVVTVKRLLKKEGYKYKYN